MATPEEQPKESPQLEGTTESDATQETEQIDVEAIMGELSKLEITEPEQITNMAHASSQTGKAFQELGQARQEIAQLKEMIQSQNTQTNEYSNYEETPNIKNEVMNAVRQVYKEEILGPQQQASEQYMQELSAIRASKDYNLVAENWDKHFNSPDVQRKMYQGETSPKKEFDDFVITFYRTLAQKSYGALQQLGQKGAKPIHVEQSGETHVETSTPEDEQKEAREKLVKEDWKGTDQDIEKMVGTFFKKGDPFLQD
jgi:hypothetical protein